MNAHPHSHPPVHQQGSCLGRPEELSHWTWLRGRLLVIRNRTVTGDSGDLFEKLRFWSWIKGLHFSWRPAVGRLQCGEDTLPSVLLFLRWFSGWEAASESLTGVCSLTIGRTLASALLRSTLRTWEHAELPQPGPVAVSTSKEKECHLLKVTEASESLQVSSPAEEMRLRPPANPSGPSSSFRLDSSQVWGTASCPSTPHPHVPCSVTGCYPQAPSPLRSSQNI